MSDKEQKAIQRIKMASEMSLHHYGKPLVCKYSGGKDSDVMLELSESVKKLQEHFGDAITADQVIDFFVDFYIAQGDPERTEGALLLTNEAVTEYRKLKERDTVMEINEIRVDEYYCPACGAENNCDQGVVEDNFCPRCGRRLKRRED